MLDMKFLRENPDQVKENIKKKFQDEKLPLVDEVIELDAKNRAAITEASELRASRNALSKQIGMLMGQAKKDPSKLEEAEKIKATVKANADRLAELEKLEEEYEQKIHKIMLLIPNIIDPSVPIGPDDSCNVEVERFGEPKVPDFEIPYHTQIMESSDGVDRDAAGRVSGAGVYYLLGVPIAFVLSPVTSGGKHGFLDADGREVLPCFFTYISDFKDGYARTNYGGSMVLRDEPNGGQWGLIDTLGRETIPRRYYYLDTPGEGLAAFMLEQFGNYGYVDVKGNVAITPRFAVARPFSGGVAVVSYNNVNYGLVDRNGNEVSSFCYKRIGKFHDGLAPFNTNLYGMNFQGMEPRCGYIDTEGREVLPAKWDDAGEFSEMRAPVMRFGENSEDFYDARWGYIATNGQLVVPFKYHEAYPFSCGLARVFVKGLGYGYINRKGEEVVPCKYQEAEDFHDFTAKVKQYDRVMTIDDKGQIVEVQ